MNIKTICACALLLTASYEIVTSREYSPTTNQQYEYEIAWLHQEIALLRHNNNKLQAENARLRNEIATLKSSQASSFAAGTLFGGILTMIFGEKSTNPQPTNDQQAAIQAQADELRRLNTQRTAGDAALAAQLQAGEDEISAQNLAQEEARNARR